MAHGVELVDMLMERAAVGTPAGRSHLRTLLTVVVERAEQAEAAFLQLVDVMRAAPASTPPARLPAAAAKPLCSVRALVAAGAMCRHVIVGATHCGYAGECGHKRVEAPAAELRRLPAETAGPPCVPTAVVEAIQAYGDTRADNTPSGPALVACVTAIREALADRPADVSAAAASRDLSPNEGDAFVLWAEIHRLRTAQRGPDGYATWQEAATDERIKRVAAERALLARCAAADERDGFEADAGPYGFDLTRQETVAPEPWAEYRDEASGHRWAGWLARAAWDGQGGPSVETPPRSSS